jgi:trigger factor
MNITRENIDDLNAVLKVEITKPDYEEKVEHVLRDYRKKANIKGFRPGMVPIGLVRKMYGRAVQIDEINKVVTENIQKYIADEKIQILGDPLPRSDEQELIDFDTQENFTFSFELGISPVFDIKLTKKNKVNRYDILVDEKMKNDYIENYTRRFGDLRNETKTEEKDVIKGKLIAIDENGNPVPEGHATESASLSIDVIQDKKIKKLFTGKAINDTVDFDIKKAFPNDSEVAGLLQIKKEEAERIEGNFRFTINEISRFHPAELGQELYDKIYGEGVVNSEEDFMNKIEDEIALSLRRETEYRLSIDIKALALDKTEFSLPEDFLKKWLLRVNENTTAEQIENDFDNFRKDLRWQLIRNKVARDNEIKITEEELLAEASNITRIQFRQYGLYYATDEQITNYARETLKREEDAKRIADKILEEKAIHLLEDMVKIDSKSITIDEFNKLFE